MLEQQGNAEEAAWWYVQAALGGGDPDAAFEAARLFYSGGNRLPKSYARAFVFLDAALMWGQSTSPKDIFDSRIEVMRSFLEQIEQDAPREPMARFILGMAYEAGVPRLIQPNHQWAYCLYDGAALHVPWAAQSKYRICSYSGVCPTLPAGCRH
jgi:TPR repeat protein